MKLRASEILTLDGVMEEPHQWYYQFADPAINNDVMAALQETDAFLFGRKTYQEMAAAWPGRTGLMAEIFNSRPKYVVSSTLTKEEVTWNNSHLINDNVAEEVQKLKEQPGGLLLINGSADLVRFLAQHNLIDEYWFSVAPLVLGKGKRLFAEGEQVRLQLGSVQTYNSGVLRLSYQSNR